MIADQSEGLGTIRLMKAVEEEIFALSVQNQCAFKAFLIGSARPSRSV